MSFSKSDEKAEVKHVEEAPAISLKNVGSASILEEKPEYHDLPESIQHLTQQELRDLDKKTKRTIDLRLMPMLIYIYILNYLDRNNIASARLGGLENDLGLKGSQYQTCIAILFVGYILFQIPSNMLLAKLGKPSLYISVLMTLWGAISACTGATKSFGGLLAVRILLGIVESGFFAAALATLSCWYDKKSLSLRNSILYSGSLMSSAWLGLIAAGILKMDGLGGLEGWRYLFIIEGALTVALVPFAYFILPDSPHNTKFLSEQEKEMIIWKLKQDTGLIDNNSESTFKSLRLALVDVKVWLVTLMLTFLVAAAGVTNFFPTVVLTLGYSRTKTLCLTAPPYCIAVLATFAWARHADKTGERFYHVTVPLIFALISFIISAATLNIAARYTAMCIMIPAIYCSFTTILSWMSSCCPRPLAKRAVAIALMNCVSNSTSIWNAYLYPSSAGPRYFSAFIANCVFVALAAATAFALKVHLTRLNKKIADGTMDWAHELGPHGDATTMSPDFRFLV